MNSIRIAIPYEIEADVRAMLKDISQKKKRIRQIKFMLARRKKPEAFDPEKHLTGELKEWYFKREKLTSTTPRNSN